MKAFGFCIIAIAMIATTLIGIAGCTPATPGPQPTPSAPTPPPPTPMQTTASQTTPATAAPIATAADSAFPVIPEGAAWTIYCLTIQTPTHVPDSERLKVQLIHRTHLPDWYLLHAEGKSTLYYGFYKDVKDASAQADRHTIERLTDDNGDSPFAACGLVPLSTADPDAPPEWDLRHAPGYWALQIAAYRGSPDRKQAAVDSVRQARAQGIQAYYYHGSAVSSVFIGTWPREAIKAQDDSVARSNDPNATIIVLPGPLPPGINTDNLFTKDGHPTKVVTPRVEVIDPTLLAAMKQYPENAVNGQVFTHKVQTPNGIVEQPDPSFLVIIPRDDGDEK